jgi:hypothetical protein
MLEAQIPGIGSVGGAPLSKRRFLRMANDMIPAANNCNSEESAQPICTRDTQDVLQRKRTGLEKLV